MKIRQRISDVVAGIVYTSVSDGLCSATYATPAAIKKAIAYEKVNGRRSALITGLERELRRREKGRKA